ncbi:DUF4362 domain-containing protein [Paenibacillus sp. OV219]|uniref:DUF4362 domain-containing protein n=1 Tax=Paenibacillus sp. OV219 TaxID=1884377 RepID=UPI0008B6397A|nr:DUF4362 domain-containing protein [Paenibacillus sp. OV219]SEO97200.1 protein of unknown function [Paenibacillus sp. OV219]
MINRNLKGNRSIGLVAFSLCGHFAISVNWKDILNLAANNLGIARLDGYALGGNDIRINRTIVILQTLIIVALLGVISILVVKPDTNKTTNNHAIIINYDRADLDRLEEMVSRFNEGHGDNLMIIEPGMDSGPVIHDVITNGREIKWTVDHSRDAWFPKNKNKIVYECKSVRLHERDRDYIDVQLSQCEGFNGKEQLPVLSFPREKL